ncbi:MAG: hypothetical protein NT007_05740, partial [Candidatus Kapabacteria bacterium]|nr:hypothetical protein [Candidatus Kapabacteria bacterium]
MQEILQNTEPPSFDKVWLMFQESDKKFQETMNALDSKFKETDRKFQETMNALDSKFKETDRQMKETDRQMKKSDKKLNKLEDLFTSQWGRLMESLVRGDLVPILNNRGIPVNVTTQRTELYYNKRKYEFDIIAENGNEIVVVEVKTTLRPRDIKEFLDELKIFKQILPKY